ncbi:MAG: threonine synthase, partial [Eggerthellaceae bacterium]|nr:threonine synthase [Eggerthellaceae bacterium]
MENTFKAHKSKVYFCAIRKEDAYKLGSKENKQGCRYIDTRGLCDEPLTFTEAVIKGIAEGGGLFVPEVLPHLSMEEILSLSKMPYHERAAYIYKAFDIDLDDEAVDALMKQTYGDNFDDEDICPITSLNAQTHILELWHGPTSAFKDMALQCLPRFFGAGVAHLKSLGKLDHDFLILVATSGDTGKAALEGFKDIDGVRIGVLYPDGGVSDIQRKQMITQSGGNVMVWGVKGNFDACQTGVKNVFGSKAFNDALMKEHKVALSSANSINWGRLLPQIVYYISAYAQMVKSGNVAAGEPIDVCVPTGNFGNILAAWYAKQIGVPIERLLCASNENHVLTDFINTGTYDIASREFKLTPSPSMDILVSSNLERQLFELTGRDASKINAWMSDLKTKKAFRIDADTFAKIRQAYAADYVDNDTCLATIKRVFEQTGYLADPHTAVALEVADRLSTDNPVLVVSTAHWAKFGNNVYRALTGLAANEDLPEAVSGLTGCQLNNVIANIASLALDANDNRIPQAYRVLNVPKNLANLDTAKARFENVINADIESIEQAVR